MVVLGEGEEGGLDLRVWERAMRVLCEIGWESVVGRRGSGGLASEEELLGVVDWVWSGESEGRREMAERISGVVVRRTIVFCSVISASNEREQPH